ncbi:MAG: hypothetical protein KKD47_06650, partial [Proteobacteria bacterium]|nr:hypothetical protein [Pseudomonadota bacterium]
SRNMTPLLETTGWWILSGETAPASGTPWSGWVSLNFDDGRILVDWQTDYKRGFAVRSRK